MLIIAGIYGMRVLSRQSLCRTGSSSRVLLIVGGKICAQLQKQSLCWPQREPDVLP